MKNLKRILTVVLVISVVAAFVPIVLALEAGKVNINKATVPELVKIKGIGEKYAERIVAYRDKNGPFKKIEDITNVKGIGPKNFEVIKNLITVE